MKQVFATIAAIVLLAASFLTGLHMAPQPQQPVLGSVTGPDVIADHFSENGVTTYSYQMQLNQASTSPGSFLTPPATTTLDVLTYKQTSGTTTASTIAFGYGTTRNATTTQIGTNYAIASGAQAYVAASTTPSTGKIVLPPSTWVSISQQGGNGTFSQKGQFQMKLTQF